MSSKKKYNIADEILIPNEAPVTKREKQHLKKEPYKPDFIIGTVNQKSKIRDLIFLRNTCIIYRYYYYSTLQMFKRNDIVSQLGTEFSLVGDTVAEIIRVNNTIVQDVFKEKLSIYQLKKRYTFLQWTIKF